MKIFAVLHPRDSMGLGWGLGIFTLTCPGYAHRHHPPLFTCTSLQVFLSVYKEAWVFLTAWKYCSPLLQTVVSLCVSAQLFLCKQGHYTPAPKACARGSGAACSTLQKILESQSLRAPLSVESGENSWWERSDNVGMIQFRVWTLSWNSETAFPSSAKEDQGTSLCVCWVDIYKNSKNSTPLGRHAQQQPLALESASVQVRKSRHCIYIFSMHNFLNT